MAKKPKKNVVEFGENRTKPFDGTGKIDVVTGNDLNNDINGAGGNDKIKGEGGDDTLVGGAGNDKIWGGAGNDTMLGGLGDDKLYADEGNDNIDGGEGDADQVFINGNFADATITLSNGIYTIVSGAQTLTVKNVELFKFADGVKTVDQLITAPPQSYILKAEPDLLTGTNGDNTFVGTETTLSSADDLDGAEGTDTLQYSSSGNVAIVESGFKTKNIENFLVTSDAVGGTTFDVTGVTGAKNITNSNSSTNLTITGLTSIIDVGMEDVSAGNFTVTYQDAALKGTADVQNVILDGNSDLAGNDVSVLTIQSFGGTTGIETLNIMTEGTATALDDIVTGAATINITGDQDLEVDQILNGATLIDASKFTGDLDVAADSGVLSVVVTGGTGDDFVDFSAGFGVGDKYDGGAGKDTIGLTNAVANAGVTGALSNVEVLAITDAATGTLDMDKFTGINEVHLDGGINVGNTELIKNAVTGLVVELDTSFVGANGSLTVDQKVDGAADSVTLNIDNIFKGDSYGVINLDDAETVNISVKDEDNTPGNVGLGGITIADLQVADATSLNFSGDADIKITDIDNNVDPTKNTLTKIDASKLTGDLNITGLGGATGVLSTAGSTILLGAGSDTLNDGTGLGADTVTTGAGKDTIFYTSVAQSSGTKVDTITDFAQGTDTLNLSGLQSLVPGDASITVTKQFVGNFASFGAAQGALTAGGGVQAVFQADTNTLWVDANDDGALNANDLQIVLTGIKALTAADLGLTAGNTINLTAPAAVLNGTTKTNADNFTTKGEDTINAAAAELVGSTIDGLAGTDTLVIEDKANATTVGAGITGVEQITLAVGTTGTGLTVNNAEVNKIAVTTGDSKVVVTNASLDLNFVGGAGSDDVTLQGGTYTKLASLNGAGAGDILGLVNNSNITAATVAGFETLRIADNATVGMTGAQHNAFTAIIGAGGNEEIFLFDTATPAAVSVTGNALVESYDASNMTAALTFTVGAAGQDIETGTGADVVIINGLTVTGDYVDNGGNDKVVLSNGTNIAGATTFSGFEGADITGTVTMTEDEHDQLAQGTLGIVAAGVADQINIATGNLVDILTAAAIETYVIADDTSNAFSVEINATKQSISAVSASDAVVFGLGATTTSFTGSITGENTTQDTLDLDDGDSVVGATITGVTKLDINNQASVSIDLADFANFTTFVAGGTNTVKLDGAGTASVTATIENYELTGTGVATLNSALADADRAAQTVTISTTGAVTLGITNAAVTAATDSAVDIFGFDQATDTLDINIGAANQNAGFQTVTAAASAVTVAANSVVEIQSTVANAIDLTAVANGGGIEAIIASAIGDTTGTIANGDDLTFIIYSGADAGIYSVDITATQADLTSADFTVELVAVVHGVGADALSSADFI